MANKQERYYRAYFQIHYQGKIHQYVRDTTATSIKEAREIIEKAWYRYYDHHMFQFEIYHCSKASLPFLDKKYENVFVEIPVRK